MLVRLAWILHDIFYLREGVNHTFQQWLLCLNVIENQRGSQDKLSRLDTV